LGALSGFFFGWAKPVPFDPRYFKHPRRDAMLVAIAGPISNLLQAPIWLLLLFLMARLTPLGQSLQTPEGFDALQVLSQLFAMGVLINITLAAFNMIPLPPLDGHYVLEFFGGEPVQRAFDSIRPFSFIILIVLLNLPAPFNIVSQVLQPIRSVSYQLISWAANAG
jgi:Zn-dependent protease